MTDPVMLLSQVHGEGRVTFRALRAAGFFTLEGVAEASVHHLADRAHLSVQTARRLREGAEEMLDRGIGGMPAPPEPSPGARARTARVAARNGRGGGPAADRSSPAAPPFSAGVSLEEAALLGQGSENPPEPALPARHPEIAAAAEMAAELTRVPPQPEFEPAPRPAPATAPRRMIAPPNPGAFWSFG